MDEEILKEAEKKGGILKYGVESSFNSRYVWRGLAWSRGPVWQPSGWISAYGLTFSTWADFVLTDEANQGKFDEVDMVLLYNRELGGFTVEPCFQYWFYPNQEDSPSTGEVSLKLAYALGHLEIFTNHAFDIVEYRKSYYGEFGLFYEHEFIKEILFEGSAYFAWGNSKFNETYIGPAKNAIDSVNVSAAFICYLMDCLYLRPHVEVSLIVDDELRNNVEVDDGTILSAGLAIGVEF